MAEIAKTMIVDCGHYRDGVRQHGNAPLPLGEAARRCDEESGFVWLGLSYSDEAELEAMQDLFGLHELAVEDAKHAHNRPKLEEYDDGYFVVLRPARYLDDVERVEFGEIHLFLGRSYAITVRHGEASELAQVRRRLESRPDLLTHGPVAVLWGVMDQVVDDYEPVVQGLDLDIEEVEQSVFANQSLDPTERIYLLKREVGEFYRAVHPLLTPLEAVEREMFAPLQPMLKYFRDINDHVKIVQEEVLAQRDQLASVLDANIALISHRQNEVIRIISAWAAMIAVPTLLASVYGMNFRHMPELAWYYGYPAALFAMALSSAGLFLWFKRARWL